MLATYAIPIPAGGGEGGNGVGVGVGGGGAGVGVEAGSCSATGRSPGVGAGCLAMAKLIAVAATMQTAAMISSSLRCATRPVQENSRCAGAPFKPTRSDSVSLASTPALAL